MVNTIIHPKPKDKKIVECLTRKLNSSIDLVVNISKFVNKHKPVLPDINIELLISKADQDLSEMDIYRRLLSSMKSKKIYVIMLYLCRNVNGLSLVDSVINITIQAQTSIYV